MEKDILGVAILATMLVSGALSAYPGSPKETTTAATETWAADFRAEDTTTAEAETTQASVELKEIAVGASPTLHAGIPNTAKEVLTSKGYELKTVECADYVRPDNVLDPGDLDANYLQHRLYLDSFNEQNGTNLVSAGAIHYESSGIYAGKTASLEELPDKATVPVPNDVSNEARAPLLLEAQGLIKLKNGVGLEATKNGTVESTKNLDIVELEAAQPPCSISNGDIAVTNGNYAIGVGLKVSDALVIEDSQSLTAATYGNVVAVKEGEESSDTTRVLAETLASPGAKQFTEEAYEDAVVPLF